VVRVFFSGVDDFTGDSVKAHIDALAARIRSNPKLPELLPELLPWLEERLEK